MSKRTIDTSLGPFVTDHYRGVAYGHMDADSRIRAVRSFDADQCRQALAMPNLQKTVRAAAERRLRMLEDLAKEQQRVNEQISHPLPPVAEINLSIFECDGCGCPGTELEHLPDEASLYCPICGTRTPTDIARCRECGCTDQLGCPEGCWWVEDDLCSSCASEEQHDPLVVSDHCDSCGESGPECVCDEGEDQVAGPGEGLIGVDQAAPRCGRTIDMFSRENNEQ